MKKSIFNKKKTLNFKGKKFVFLPPWKNFVKGKLSAIKSFEGNAISVVLFSFPSFITAFFAWPINSRKFSHVLQT